MGERTSYDPGTFCWTDLTTSDLEAAKAFYGGLFGWEFEDMPTDAGPYSMASLDGRTVAAAMAATEQPPNWSSYVSVADVDETVQRAEAAGAAISLAPLDVYTSGRMAVVQDPTGAYLGLWQPRDHIGASLVNVHGALTWNELATTDIERAAEFYAAVFGWGVDRPDPRYFVVTNQGRSNGGIRLQDPQMEAGVPPNWLTYFASDDLDATRSRAEELGGSAIVGAMDVPQGRFAVLADPQGAVFALFSGSFDD